MQELLKRIKRQSWVQPLMPRLRVVRRNWEALRHTPALWQEEKASKHWALQQFADAALIEQALDEVGNAGGYFGGWALARSALRTFCTCLFRQRSQPLIVEFGSGQSTLFWSALQKKLAFRFYDIEHHAFWYSQLKPKVPDHADFHYLLFPLGQVTGQDRQKLWQSPEQACSLFLELGTTVPESEHENTRLPDAFYAMDCAALFAPESIDGVVLDGPNGNGRAIAFPLLQPFLKPDAWMLIDDFDHYPFLDELGKIYTYRLEHVQINAGKRWCLVQLTGKQSAAA